MKKNIIILTLSLLIISLIIISIILITTTKQKEKKSDNDNSTPAISEIELNSKQYINQLEKIKIKGTNDTIMITKKVKWEVPNHEKAKTISFAIAIPYTITIDGKEYDGTYHLGSFENKKTSNNPKYNFQVTNLTKEGDIEVLITKK